MQFLRNVNDLEKAMGHLFELQPEMGRIASQIANIPLRLMPAGFAGLSQVITGQLISKKAAAVIFTRLQSACVPLTADTYLRLSSEVIAGIGLTRAKQTVLQILALDITEGALDLEALSMLTSDEAMKVLMRYNGVGAWTAEVYLMFSCGHVDIFPAGDLALRAAAAHAFNMGNRPEIKELRIFSSVWKPYRSVAARILWAYYAEVMKRDVIPID